MPAVKKDDRAKNKRKIVGSRERGRPILKKILGYIGIRDNRNSQNKRHPKLCLENVCAVTRVFVESAFGSVLVFFALLLDTRLGTTRNQLHSALGAHAGFRGNNFRMHGASVYRLFSALIMF